MHSVLIVGCGSIGERHLRCLNGTGRARVTACDSSAALRNRLVRDYAVPVMEDWEAALAEGDFDAVVISTPAHLHVPMALRVLESGRHVLIEKPLAVSFAGVDDLLGAHEKSGCEAAVAYIYHSMPILNEVRAVLHGGELGSIRQVTATCGQHFPTCRPAHAAPYSQTYYRDRRTGGGAIQDGLTHVANWLESILGPTDSVMCDCAHQVLADVTVEDTVHLSARHGDVLVSYALNQFQAPNEVTYQFNTEIGSLKIEFHNQRWGVFRHGDRAWKWHEPPPVERDAHFIVQAGAFLDQIEGEPSRLCSLEAAARTLRFNLAALASSERGARVGCADMAGTATEGKKHVASP